MKLRKNHASPTVKLHVSQTSCNSPTSHSSDSERGFLTGIPDHMKSFQCQRPWEVSYYTNVIIEPPTPAQVIVETVLTFVKNLPTQ